jgi:hypothetical protein
MRGGQRLEWRDNRFTIALIADQLRIAAAIRR